MWKAATKSVVMAVAMVGLGTGCDLASILNQLADQITNPGDPADPQDPVSPPGDPGVPGDPSDPEPPPIDPNDPWFFCEVELDECLNGVWGDPNGAPDQTEPWPLPGEDQCFVQFDECLGNEPPPPIDPWCEIELDECLNGWGDPNIGGDAYYPFPGEELCFAQYDECMGWIEPPPPPPFSPCDELVGLCLQSGVEPGLCEEVYSQCLANNPDQPCDPPGWDEGEGDDGNDDVVPN